MCRTDSPRAVSRPYVTGCVPLSRATAFGSVVARARTRSTSVGTDGDRMVGRSWTQVRSQSRVWVHRAHRSSRSTAPSWASISSSTRVSSPVPDVNATTSTGNLAAPLNTPSWTRAGAPPSRTSRSVRWCMLKAARTTAPSPRPAVPPTARTMSGRGTAEWSIASRRAPLVRRRVASGSSPGRRSTTTGMIEANAPTVSSCPGGRFSTAVPRTTAFTPSYRVSAWEKAVNSAVNRDTDVRRDASLTARRRAVGTGRRRKVSWWTASGVSAPSTGPVIRAARAAALRTSAGSAGDWVEA